MLEALPDDESLMGLTGADFIARTLPKRTDKPDFPIDNKSNQSGTSASSYETAKPTQDQRRTLRFSNLPNVGPLKSFAAMRNVIKVGQIIEFSAVHNDGSVCDVSMAHGADGFRNHVRQHVLNIAGKNVIGDWAPKLKISDKLTKAIGKGTTRIVVIVGARDKIRPKHIKHDLARINGLIVLSITEPGRDVVIETHSMRMAGLCRDALLQNDRYRGFDIAYASDSCAEPIIWKGSSVG